MNIEAKYTNVGAIVSSCGKFRYRLWRYWGNGYPLIFVMLNPSKADGALDDPTIRKCVGFAKRLGFDGIEVVNLYAYRATDPVDLRRAGYPVGPDNDMHINAVIDSHHNGRENVVCAWGTNVRGLSRWQDVVRMLRQRCVGLHAIALSDTGIPLHPLMQAYRDKLVEYTAFA